MAVFLFSFFFFWKKNKILHWAAKKQNQNDMQHRGSLAIFLKNISLWHCGGLLWTILLSQAAAVAHSEFRSTDICQSPYLLHECYSKTIHLVPHHLPWYFSGTRHGWFWDGFCAKRFLPISVTKCSPRMYPICHDS